MLYIQNSLLLRRGNVLFQNKKYFWKWVNVMFNRVDEERKKQFGADRTCAEWVLRNGGAIRWLGESKLLSDYNALPLEGSELYIEEIDGTDSSIMHYGFDHLVGCNHITKITLTRCGYLEDPALGLIYPVNNTLRDLIISGCKNITHKGLMQLGNLTQLKSLTIHNLTYFNSDHYGEVLNHLKQNIPGVQINFKP